MEKTVKLNLAASSFGKLVLVGVGLTVTSLALAERIPKMEHRSEYKVVCRSDTDHIRGTSLKNSEKTPLENSVSKRQIFTVSWGGANVLEAYAQHSESRLKIGMIGAFTDSRITVLTGDSRETVLYSYYPNLGEMIVTRHRHVTGADARQAQSVTSKALCDDLIRGEAKK